MTEVTLTELRRDIFRLVDRALETGEEIVFQRNGRRMVVRAEPEEPEPTYQEVFDRWMAGVRTYEDLSPSERAELDAEMAREDAEHRAYQDEQHARWLAKWDARLSDTTEYDHGAEE
jgi:antitoxin (DNA-binding transcriptional repressor) of toxin-antitoxin stability system